MDKDDLMSKKETAHQIFQDEMKSQVTQLTAEVSRRGIVIQDLWDDNYQLKEQLNNAKAEAGGLKTDKGIKRRLEDDHEGSEVGEIVKKVKVEGWETKNAESVSLAWGMFCFSKGLGCFCKVFGRISRSVVTMEGTWSFDIETMGF